MFDWASRLFQPKVPKISRLFNEEGILILLDARHTEAEELSSSEALGYVQQLSGEERFSESSEGLLLPWSEVYLILEDLTGADELGILGLPKVQHLVPKLLSENTLISPDFTVGLDGWRGEDGKDLNDVLTVGALAYVGTRHVLLPPRSYQLLKKLESFYDVSVRTQDYNRRLWGEMRQMAVEAGAVLDQFLYSNVILTPETLAIQLNRQSPAGVSVVEIEPWFAGAPDNWLTIFDGLSKVRDIYEIPTQQGICQVIVTPKIKKVLQAIKKMPGRRVAGAFGEKFLSNPFAVFGGDADDVIDPDQFEQAREEAGILFQRFTARVLTDSQGEISEIGILVQRLGIIEASSTYEGFANPRDLGQFINGIETRLKTGSELYQWCGHDLDLTGDTPREIETLKIAYAQWLRPQITIRYADVADLKRYSERIVGIGVQKPLVSQYIPRSGEEEGWFPEDNLDREGKARPVTVNIPDAGGKEFQAAVTPEIAQTVRELVSNAKKAGVDYVEWPELGTHVPLAAAEDVANQSEEMWAKPEDRERASSERKAKNAKERKELLLRANVESAEYLELRLGELKLAPARKPSIPSTIRPDVQFKDHQLVGISWMQNLIENSPEFCRGAVLADDMGLGKTLQLLTVIAKEFEHNPEIAPVLIVAPVSLLENWKAEAEKFFMPDTFKLLTLYGENLSALREMPSNIDDELRELKIDRFLQPNWLGNSKVVLTTYETLRDLEFSFAAVRWSIMVCDEAQKIKNPAAMVTRAAKKQNVAFKIACTGTPVENSLADLWCLFDFMQPGLLGALNEFGDTYRRPIECHGDPEAENRIKELAAIIDPQILRRLKVDVAKDLPAKNIVDLPKKNVTQPIATEISRAVFLPMSSFQRKLYADALELFKRRREPGYSGPFANHLGLLHYLRQVCTDPQEIGKVFTPEPLSGYRKKSPKLDWFLDCLETVRQKGEKAIVFVEFRPMQRMLVHYIEEVFGYRPDVINGETTTSVRHAQSRQKRIEAFQKAKGFGVIVLSPIAVGFGVNIQAANHVFHYSRTWNPAKEDQATDRAYRIGQTKTVYVYYPVVYADSFKTFDEKLHELLEYKRGISKDMLNGTGNILPSEFDDVIGVGGDIFNERLTINDAIRFQPDYFEALTAALWMKRGFRTVLRVGGKGDDGVDVVAKTQKVGELIQCKSSTVPESELDWDAVKEVVAGHASYKARFAGTQFKLICITNQFFNKNAHRLAELNEVKLFDQHGLKQLLDENHVTLSDLEKHLFFTT